AVRTGEIEDGVGDRPGRHHSYEAEDERPRTHAVSQLVGGALGEGELIAGRNRGVAVPHRHEPTSTLPDVRRLTNRSRHRCLPFLPQLALLVFGLGATGVVVLFVADSLLELFRSLTEGTSQFGKL